MRDFVTTRSCRAGLTSPVTKMRWQCDGRGLGNIETAQIENHALSTCAAEMDGWMYYRLVTCERFRDSRTRARVFKSESEVQTTQWSAHFTKGSREGAVDSNDFKNEQTSLYLFLLQIQQRQARHDSPALVMWLAKI
jgi:hypothetical protein